MLLDSFLSVDLCCAARPRVFQTYCSLLDAVDPVSFLDDSVLFPSSLRCTHVVRFCHDVCLRVGLFVDGLHPNDAV